MVLMFGAFLGLFSVGFGAYSEHGLKPIITHEEFRYLMTAIRYNQVNSVMISSIGIARLSSHKLSNIPAFIWSGRVFVIGSILFSFSIYLSVFLNIKELTYITPFGGTTLMAAWALLFVSVLQLDKNGGREKSRPSES